MVDENHDEIKDETTERCPKCNMPLLGVQKCMNCENRDRSLRLLGETLRLIGLRMAEDQAKEQLSEEE
jgi:hypothetical protein